MDTLWVHTYTHDRGTQDRGRAKKNGRYRGTSRPARWHRNSNNNKKKSVAVPIYLPAAVGGRSGAVGVCGGVGVAATTVRQERGRPLAGREWDRSHTRERAGLATPPPCRGHHSGGRACAPQRISDSVLRGHSLVSHSRFVRRNAGRADRTSTRFHCIQLCSCHNELLCNMYFRSQLMTRCQPRWQRRWSRQLWRGPPVAASSKHIHSHPLTMAPTVNRGPFAFARARRGRHVVTPASTSSSADRDRHFVVFVPLLHLRPPLSPAAAQPRPPNSPPPPLPL